MWEYLRAASTFCVGIWHYTYIILPRNTYRRPERPDFNKPADAMQIPLPKLGQLYAYSCRAHAKITGLINEKQIAVAPMYFIPSKQTWPVEDYTIREPVGPGSLITHQYRPTLMAFSQGAVWTDWLFTDHCLKVYVRLWTFFCTLKIYGKDSHISDLAKSEAITFSVQLHRFLFCFWVMGFEL